MNAQTATPEFFSHQVGEARRFYLDLNPPRNGPLAVVCGGLERCAADYAINRATFPYWCIEYVVHGRGWLSLSSFECGLRAGSVFAYGPGIRHHIRSDPRAPMVKYFVDFVGRRASPLLRDCGLEGGGIAQVFPPDSVTPLYEELIQSGTHSSANSAILCSKLLECIALRIGSASAPSAASESTAFSSYLRCRELIETHFLRLRTLEQIADECGMDPAYICRLFRRFGHQTPYQYLLRLKINYAAVELQRSDALVKNVAMSVGFADTFHFSRVFHSILGSSPAEFRRLR